MRVARSSMAGSITGDVFARGSPGRRTRTRDRAGPALHGQSLTQAGRCRPGRTDRPVLQLRTPAAKIFQTSKREANHPAAGAGGVHPADRAAPTTTRKSVQRRQRGVVTTGLQAAPRVRQPGQAVVGFDQPRARRRPHPAPPRGRERPDPAARYVITGPKLRTGTLMPGSGASVQPVGTGRDPESGPT